MEEILEKWKNDKRYRTKIKLLLYTLFVIVVSIYAISLDRKSTKDIKEDIEEIKVVTEDNTINLPEEYNYKIDININDIIYKYYGLQTAKTRYITKESNDVITNYIFENNEYYIEDTTKIDNYIKTTREEVYDVINYNYINIDTINTYLSKATKEDNHYLVYLKDIILGNDSDKYFTITKDNNNINIDYTNLMQAFDNNVEKYIIDITIEEKE